MNDSQALVLLPTAELILAINNPTAPVIRADAIKARDEIVERSKSIERVIGGTSQQVATDMLGELTKLLNGIDNQRQQVKRPFLNFNKKLDADVSKFAQPLEAEKARLKAILSLFAAEQLRKEAEARRKQEEELARLAAERKAAELAAQLATNSKEAEQAQEQIAATDLKAVEVVMAPAPATVARAEGMKVIPRWKTEVVNIDALYRAFPDLVKLEPRMREINAAVSRMAEAQPDQEPALPGCRITKEVDVQVR